MKIGHKLLLAFSGLTLLVGIVGFFGLSTSQRVLKTHEGGEAHFRSIVENALAVSHAVKEAETQLYLNVMVNREPRDAEVIRWQEDLKERVCLLEDRVKIPEAQALVKRIESNTEQFLTVSSLIEKSYSEDVAMIGKFDVGRHKELFRRLNKLAMFVREDALRLARFETDFLNRQTTITAATEVSSFARRAEGHLMLYLTLHDPEDRGRFFQRHQYLRDRITIIEERVHTAEAEKMLRRIKEESDILFSVGTYLLAAYDEEMKRSGGFDTAAHSDLLFALESAAHGVGNEGMNLAAHNLRMETALREGVHQAITSHQRTVLTVFSIAVFIALAFGIGLSRTISGSLKKLRDGAAAVGRGELDTRIDVTSKDETGDVARSFNAMVEELQTSRADLLAVKEDLERQVDDRTRDLRKLNEQLMIDIDGRIRAEAALRESEEYFRTLIEDAADMITVLSGDGTIRYCSPSVRRVLGYQPEFFIGKNAFEFMHPEDMPRVLAVFGTAIQNPGANYSAQYRFRHEDGSFRTLESVGKSLAGAKELTIVINSRDISERKHAEEALRRSEERYRTLIETMNDGLGIVDAEGIITFVNESACRMLGYSREELIGRSAPEFVEHSERDVLHEQLAKRREGVQEPYELRWKHRDGGTVLTIVSPRALYDSEGNYSGSFGIFTDITHLKQAEEALRQSEERYRIVADNTYDWEFWLSPEGKFLYTSPSCSRVTGYHVADFEADPDLLFRIIHPDDSNYFIFHRHRVEEKMVTDEIVFRIVDAHGAIKWIGHVCQPVFDGEGTFIGTRGSNRDITDRKKASDALKESEEKYRALMNDAGDAIFLADVEGAVIDANRKAEELTGYTREELLDMRVGDIMHDDHRKHGLAAFKEVVAGGLARLPEGVIRRKDGAKVVVDVVARLIKYGDTSAAQAILRDVTERRKAEEALRRSEARYRAIVEDQTELICRFLPDGTLTFVNDAYCRYFGKTRKQLLGTHFMPLIPEEDHALIQRYLQAFGPQDPVATAEHRVFDSEGRIRWQQWTDRAIFDEAGNLLEFQSVGRDITDHKIAEEALRESERRFRMLVENLPQKIFLKDENSVYLYCNENFARDFGIRREMILGKTDHDLYGPRSAEKHLKEDRAIVKSCKPLSAEARYEKGGRDVIIHVFKTPILDDEGHVKAILGIIWDVTERARLESLAEAVNTMENIGYVFSGIRHEIGNPINSLKITLSVLKSKADEYSKEMCMQYIDRAMSEIARVEYLLRALKTFNLYEVPDIQAVHMCEFLDKFVSLVSGDCEKKGISLSAHCEPDAERAYADTRALQQVLLNVMVNAMDALEGREDPSVNIRVSRDDGTVRISVADNGCGMSEEQQRDLFKPFRTTKAKGTGLGLVIARKMLARMSGTISVATRKGEGTTVEIKIPEGGSGQ